MSVPKAAPIPDLARFVDHTLLRPDATRADVERLCAEAREFGFAAVCVNPVWARLAAGLVRGSAVAACSVVSFPLGATPTDVKGCEARRCISDGSAK